MLDSKTRRRVGARRALAALLLACAPSVASAQAPPQSDARLQGVVVDAETHQPVPGARVVLVGMDTRDETGRWGAFAFPDAPFGTSSIRVSAPGYLTVVQDVEVVRGRIAFIQAVLPTLAATLEGLVVVGDPASSAASQVAETAADMLADRVPRARVFQSEVGSDDYRLALRAGATLTGVVAPMIVIDGVITSSTEAAYEALRAIPATDVEEMEVLKGPSATARYPLAANGVVIVRTKRGR